MDPKDAALVFDLGTSAVKCGLVDLGGAILAQTSVERTTNVIDIAGAEQDVDGLWAAINESAIACLRASRSCNVVVISVTGPRGTFAILDQDLQALTPFITWQDRRAADWEESWASEAQRLGYRALTGMDLTCSAALPRLLHLRQQRPELLRLARHIVTPQSLALRLLGADRYYLDFSTAAHFGLFSLAELSWSPPLLAAAALSDSLLPQLTPPGSMVGSLSEPVAREWGLRGGLPLVVAGSDGVCAELGTGVVDTGEIYAYLGTASAIAGPLDIAAGVPLEGGAIVMPGSEPSVRRVVSLGGAGGSVATWMTGVLGLPHVEDLSGLAAASPPGANGVVFLPALAGAGPPRRSSKARASFLGLSFASTRSDLARAVMEGVAAEIAFMLDDVSATTGLAPTSVVLTGGGSNSPLWCQIVADSLSVPVHRSNVSHPGLVGASLYAASALTGSSVRSLARSSEVGAATMIVADPDEKSSISRRLDIYHRARDLYFEGSLDSMIFEQQSRAGLM